MAKSKHDQISERLARKHGVVYNRGKGPDVKGKDQTIEVAVTPSDIRSSVAQVCHHRKPYIATDKPHLDQVLDAARHTKVGVMDEHGNIVKRTGGKKGD
ncbi:MAG: hypothetical protein ABIE70_05150 [bacterium]